MKISKDTFVELNMMRTRGGMAAAVMMRGQEPTDKQKFILRKNVDSLSLRDIGEFYHSLDMRADFTLVPMEEACEEESEEESEE